MIPLQLQISGFLSYRDKVDVDFTSFNLACISGQNGAGKSSLLDAITWALFGEARAKDKDSIINLQSDTAKIVFTFAYENNVFQVLRSVQKGKSTTLEFQVQSDDGWRALTEKTTRETEKRIEQILRLDYETFVNASFFLQGKADEFTQKKASDRKNVLSNILGLEIWEEYKNRAAEKRKDIERDVDEIDGRVAEIDAELSEEEARKQRLAEIESNLKQLTFARAAQESILENIKKNAALLDEQRRLAKTLATSLERTRSALAGLESRLAAKGADRDSYADLVNRAKEIESAYKAWQKARKDLEEFDGIAAQFREHDEKRQPLLREIDSEKARLEQELSGLRDQEKVISEQLSVSSELNGKIESAQKSLDEAEAKLRERDEAAKQLQSARERQAELKAENEALKADMNQIKERIDSLKAAEGAECPLCGQELTEKHRKSTLKQLESEGKQKGDLFRANQKETSDLAGRVTSYELRITQLNSADGERLTASNIITQLTERLETLESQSKDWEKTSAKRLKEVDKILANGKYAVDEQKQLAKLDKELAKLGYDVSAHDAARNTEVELRAVEEDYSNLKSAKEVNKQIESEIASLNSEIENRKSEITSLEHDYQSAKASLESAEAQSPDLDQAERELFRLREDENKTRAEMGGAQQRVDILKTQRARKADFEKEREELQKQIAHHKTLERAFGKDGVPALLIEQALPQIESKANELLGRLSNDQMMIEFSTLEKYKDEKRKDLRETLEIRIKDSAGWRDYEMYSGGEAFRVNFAIRLALSEILAQRKGARLQTLVIDEGFGSQDIQGRQRLIEAINLVKHDFAKILIITHLDELKDAFPTRIEVEKTERGSTVHVI